MGFNVRSFKSLADFNKQNIINAIIDVEGGYVNNPHDKGGETNFGITVAVARANGYTGSMRNLTKAQAYAIYEKMYWNRNRCDELLKFHPCLALHVFDMAVNSGSGAIIKHLQRLINVSNRGGRDYPDISVDGAIGPGTIRALEAYNKRNPGKMGNFVLMMVSMQGGFYVSICENRPLNETFMNGWAQRATDKLRLFAQYC